MGIGNCTLRVNHLQQVWNKLYKELRDKPGINWGETPQNTG
jgi:hypothetical protein